MVDENSERTILVVSRGTASDHLQPEDLPEFPDEPVTLLMSGLAVPAESTGRAAEALLDRLPEGSTVYFDPNLRLTPNAVTPEIRALYQRLAERADVVLAGDSEIQSLDLRRRPGQVLVRTSGAAGSRILSDDGDSAIPAISMAVVNATGAGDAYAAAFVAARIFGHGLDESGALATAAGGLAVTYPSAQADFAWEDVVQTTPHLDEKSLVIGFSSSGKSVYAVEALSKARELGARTLAIANKEDSRLQETAEASILTKAGDSFTFPTKTTTTALLVAWLVAQRAGELRGWNSASTAASVESIVASTEDALASTDAVVEEYAPGVDQARRVLVIGSGLGRTAALVGAAKLIETSHVATTSCNCEEFLHLQGFGTSASDAVVVVHDGNLRSRLAIEYAVSQGCHTVVVNHGDASELPEEAHIIQLRDTDPVSALFGSIVALQALASEVSRIRGTNPDIPTGVDLDYVIGLLYTDPVDGWNATAAKGIVSAS